MPRKPKAVPVEWAEKIISMRRDLSLNQIAFGKRLGVSAIPIRPHDRAWLDYKEEIGLRHTPEKKNKTDNRHTPQWVPLRYLLTFVPVVTPVRRFFENAITDRMELDGIERAWIKAVHLHVTLWTRPYSRDGLW